MIVFEILPPHSHYPYFDDTLKNEEFDEVFPNFAIFNSQSISECVTELIDYYVEHSFIIQGLKVYVDEDENVVTLQTAEGKIGVHYAYGELSEFGDIMLHNGNDRPIR